VGNPFGPITVDYAIEECTDLAKLRHLARLYRAAMLSEHEQGAHFLARDCVKCRKAFKHGEPAYACGAYKARQDAFMAALRADVILGPSGGR
jgi:hypothetical protein